jgi:DNA-3-methyladenine glycosylase
VSAPTPGAPVRPGPGLRPVARPLLEADSLHVAPLLLGKLLVHGELAGRIVEVEAYRGEADPASHAYRGRTARNASMFGAAGLLYVYFAYGMHWCANVVCGVEGVASAVLLRALEPVHGLELMRSLRAARRRDAGVPPDRDLCRGPANLACALAIGREDDGVDLVRNLRHAASLREGPWLADDGRSVPVADVASGPRVGITRATEQPWRFWVSGSPWVSGPTRGPRPSGRALTRR